jgi:hypothetical protein
MGNVVSSSPVYINAILPADQCGKVASARLHLASCKGVILLRVLPWNWLLFLVGVQGHIGNYVSVVTKTAFKGGPRILFWCRAPGIGASIYHA